MSTTKVCVIGFPVAHSLSPAMHSAAFLALELDWSYGAVEVEPGSFERRVRELAREGFAGANVTVPHKPAALALADEATERATGAGAANTLVFDGGGRIRAENTDIPGLIRALERAGAADLGGKRALVLGAGGAGRGAAYALLEAGLSPVFVWNRTSERAGALAARLVALGDGGWDARLAVAPSDVLGQADVLVNATSVGMGESPVDADSVREAELAALGLDERALADLPATVVDMAYRPGGTALISEAAKRGRAVVDGLAVLVEQGAVSFEIWTGRPAPVAVMEAAIRSLAGGTPVADP